MSENSTVLPQKIYVCFLPYLLSPFLIPYALFYASRFEFIASLGSNFALVSVQLWVWDFISIYKTPIEILLDLFLRLILQWHEFNSAVCCGLRHKSTLGVAVAAILCPNCSQLFFRVISTSVISDNTLQSGIQNASK